MHTLPPVAVPIAVITVSTSRYADATIDDRGGDVLAELAVGAGHSVVRRDLVPDDPAAIVVALRMALAGEARLVLLTGGTGLSARDCTPDAIRPVFDRPIPGFGELFRMLSHAQVGSKAMLSDAVGGVVSGKLVFSLPGSPPACELGMRALILPELAHLLSELGKEGAAPARATLPMRAPPKPTPAEGTPAPTKETAAAVQTEVPQGISLTVAPDAERLAEAPIASGWEAGLRGLGGTITTGEVEIPPALLRMQAVVDVLQSAGTRGLVRLADGTEYGAYGFPDLARRGSKVLLVREVAELAEIIALHRWPNLVGLCGEEGVLPSTQLAVPSFTADRCGRPYVGQAEVFAVDGKIVWLRSGRRVFAWEGKGTESQALSKAEPVSSALATLVLGWSGR